nr:hypothetical protein [Tanacetum cinerariifolium]
KVIHEFHDSKGYTFLSEELPDIDSFNDIHPHFDDDPFSGSTTFSANSLLEEFADELALISYPPNYDDYRVCDIESDIKEIEFLLYQGEDSDFKYLIDQSVLTNLDDLFVDPIPEMFTDEQPPDYSFLPRFDIIPRFMKILANGFHYLKSSLSPLFNLESLSVRCQKPGHLAARLGCAKMKVATWDDLAFKIKPFGLKVKHLNVFCKDVDLELKF